MARPRAKAPARRYHISGQSIVTIAGRDFYLGPHDSPESIARYAVLIGIYQAGGLKLPDDFSLESIEERVLALGGQNVAFMPNQASTPILVRHVTALYRDHIEVKYVRNEQESNRYKQICTKLETMFGNVLAENFGPVKLREFRDDLIVHGLPTVERRKPKTNLARKYVNRLTNCVIKIFRHAVAGELVEASKISQLQSLEPLRHGQTTAPEVAPVQPVNIEHVRSTAEHLSPIIKAMVRVQIATGMRPGELCIMRPCDIKRSQELWVYAPSQYKTLWRGKSRAIPLVGDAREAITDYLQRDPEAFCFSPKEAMAWRHAVAAANRTTPLSCGNRIGTNRKKAPKREPRDRYDPASYRQAIQRAQKKAGSPHWFPYQLRHLNATTIRAALGGIEEAGALLGHSTALMTEHYAQKSIEAAVMAANVAPKL